MSRIKRKRHEVFFRIPGYQIIKGVNDREIAGRLGCSVRTYRDKILGWAEFKPLEAQELSAILHESQDDLFFTNDVSMSTPPGKSA